MVKTMNAHPAADTFPMMTSDELKTLAEDIRAQGLHRPIVLLDGLILDGRNRFEACKLAGVTPRFVQFDGDDPWAYVWSENAERRHLRPDQRVACRLGWGVSRDRWLATQQRVAEDANRKRSEATKAQPRTEDGTRLASGVLPRGKTPDANRVPSSVRGCAFVASLRLRLASSATRCCVASQRSRDTPHPRRHATR